MFPNAMSRLKRWLLHENQEPRRAPRAIQPELVVHYWDGSIPEGRGLRDINKYGAYIYTSERWYPGTVVRIILQGHRIKIREDGTTAPEASTCLTARVVRHGPDGVAVDFSFLNERERDRFQAFLEAIPVPPARALASGSVSREKGQALLEFALIVPLVFILAVNAVNFAGFIFAWITVADAARSGAQYMALSSASPGTPTAATLAQITALVGNDVTSLKNRSSATVAICTNSTAGANGCTTLSDPEAPAYTLATVDVTYTYNPYIPLFSFPKLGIGATLPSGTVHRKAVMRMLQ
jgi:Flp pilus assembly protein TadG